MYLFLSFLFLKSIRCSENEYADEDEDMWGFDDDDEPREINWSEVPVYDVIILGSGPAGSTAALYTARAGYKPLVIHGGVPGGQLTYTSEIENYPGFEGTGTDLVHKMEEQATKAGAKYIYDNIASVNLSVFPRQLTSETNKGYKCKSLIIATGAKAKYLGLESEQKFINAGVSACAVCDGALYSGKDVAIVGGGDVAAEEALYLAKICKSVTLYHRRNELRASLPMKKRLNESTVKIVYDTVIDEVLGDKYVTGIKVKNVKTGEISEQEISGLFVAIGHAPQTKLFEGQLDLDANGYFVTNGTPETKVPGVFVAGDCADKVYRQAVTSAGTGCQAALLAERYLVENAE